MQDLEPEVEAASPERLKTLADGVFAIVMTLLVLELGVPTAAEAVDNTELTDALREMWPEFLAYGLSFMVLGVYWIIHHMIFDAIKRYDTALAWLNIVFLMFAALIPFSTALWGEHGETTVTALFYGVNMLVIFEMGWAMWWYATAGRRLVDADLDPGIITGGRAMGLVYNLVFLIPLLLAFVAPTASFILYALFVAAFIAATLAGKGEVVAVWRPRRHDAPRTP